MLDDGAEAEFRETGILDAGAILDPIVAERVARKLPDWHDNNDIGTTGDTATKVILNEPLLALALHPALTGLAAGLLGPEISLHPMQHVRQDIGLWQQDRGLLRPTGDDTQMVALWVALSDNATLDVATCAALSDHEGTPPHLPEQTVAELEVRTITAKTGQVIAAHPLLARRVSGGAWIDLRMQVTGQHSGCPQLPNFIAKSEIAPENILPDVATWQRGWDTALRRIRDEPPRPSHRWGD